MTNLLKIVRITSFIPPLFMVLDLFTQNEWNLSENSSILWGILIIITISYEHFSKEALKLLIFLPIGLFPIYFFWIFSRLIEGHLLPFPH